MHCEMKGLEIAGEPFVSNLKTSTGHAATCRIVKEKREGGRMVTTFEVKRPIEAAWDKPDPVYFN